MRIKSLHIEGFRSVGDLTMTFDPKLTILVGENNTGKSTVGVALLKVFMQASIGNDLIVNEDYPYSNPGQMTIEATLDLSHQEVEKQLVAKLVPPEYPGQDSPLHKWLRQQGLEVKFTVIRPSSPSAIPSALRWGQLHIIGGQVSIGSAANPDAGGRSWLHVARPAAEGGLPDIDGAVRGQFSLDRTLGSEVAVFAMSRYKRIEEFRDGATQGLRSGGTETLTGADVASVLFNLRNHRTRPERLRYGAVISALKSFFPRYNEIVAVESTPGGGAPEVQFYENGHPNPLSGVQLSAGAQQVVTMVTTLVAREGLVIFLENPEANLHPHGKRFLQRLVRQAAGQNQIIVTTHDPHFVEPDALQGLRRFWWTKQGTQVCGPGNTIPSKQSGQMKTALRLLGNREVFFARAVLLVEDESQQLFLMGTAPTLEKDMDAHGVSIIPVGGENGFEHFHALLDALGIPHINLKDKPWGDDRRYPPHRYFSLGAELEDFLDSQGLAEKRKGVIQQVGTNKPRVAAELGARLKQDEIPSIFQHVLDAAIHLATGEPEAPNPSIKE